ncbi:MULTISPECIES: hypothetical protein [unclassified Microbacterium]|uniref:hypothetical protein n=1 Tax=unclassified Microbacterium TaxID=2609290 RepID=UPI0028830896|nr:MULTISPECIES: hypothetical protein [unclassified Microbacterium]
MTRLSAHEIDEELSNHDPEDMFINGSVDLLSGQLEHIYESERCVFCDTNVYDVGLPGVPAHCSREPITYSTDTGGAHPGMSTCAACNGAGHRADQMCTHCSGRGEVPIRETWDEDW